jgi:hypothetical protein
MICVILGIDYRTVRLASFLIIAFTPTQRARAEHPTVENFQRAQSRQGRRGPAEGQSRQGRRGPAESRRGPARARGPARVHEARSSKFRNAPGPRGEVQLILQCAWWDDDPNRKPSSTPSNNRVGTHAVPGFAAWFSAWVVISSGALRNLLDLASRTRRIAKFAGPRHVEQLHCEICWTSPGGPGALRNLLDFAWRCGRAGKNRQRAGEGRQGPVEGRRGPRQRAGEGQQGRQGPAEGRRRLAGPARAGRGPARAGRGRAKAGMQGKQGPAEGWRGPARAGRGPARVGRGPAKAGRARKGRQRASEGRQGPAEGRRGPAEGQRRLAGPARAGRGPARAGKGRQRAGEGRQRAGEGRQGRQGPAWGRRGPAEPFSLAFKGFKGNQGENHVSRKVIFGKVFSFVFKGFGGPQRAYRSLEAAGRHEPKQQYFV